MKNACLFFTFALVFSPAAVADEVRLVNGEVYKAIDWRVDGDFLVILTARGEIRIPRARVAEIVVEGAEESDRTERRPVFRPQEQTVNSPSTALERQFAMPDEVLPLIQEGNIAAALRVLEEFIGPYAESEDFRLLRGALLIRAGQFSEAQKEIGVLLGEHPADSYALFILGQAAYFQGRWPEALEHFRASLPGLGMESIKERVLSRIGELEGENRSAFRESDNFVVRAVSENIGTAAPDTVLGLLEDHYGQIAGELGYAARQKIVAVIYDAVYAGTEERELEGAYDGKIKLAARVLSSPRLSATVAHELVHAVLLSRTRGNCPVWLHEGLAQFLSGLRSRNILPGSGNPRNRPGALSLYPDSLTLVEFLVERYSFDRVRTLLSLLHDGWDPERAVAEAFGRIPPKLRMDRDEWLLRLHSGRR